MSGTNTALASVQEAQETSVNEAFLNDVLSGLTQPQKKLSSKYFYDETGDSLFQQIMRCEDYYLTRCEMEVFRESAADLLSALDIHQQEFDLIELGAGDGVKTRHMLRYLSEEGADFRYLPVDISAHILEVLCEGIQQNLTGVKIRPFEGDYFDALSRIDDFSQRRKVLLFLGSNIGNMPVEDCQTFCIKLAEHMNTGDVLITGFDLKKDPRTILRAYDDSDGLTRDFNLNLLRRINNELGADFDLNGFEHYQTYNPLNGACQSFLISQREQNIRIAGQVISFEQHEPVFMEVSRKFSLSDIDDLATTTGFTPVKHCSDSKGWFVNAVWTKN